MYILIYKKEQNLKSEKFKAQVLKKMLIRYDGYIINKIFI